MRVLQMYRLLSDEDQLHVLRRAREIQREHAAPETSEIARIAHLGAFYGATFGRILEKVIDSRPKSFLLLP